MTPSERERRIEEAFRVAGASRAAFLRRWLLLTAREPQRLFDRNFLRRTGLSLRRGKLAPEGISVVIPAYNAGRFLARTIDAVLAQTRPADEIVVVDDGSTDDTREVVAGYGARVSYLWQKNAYVGAARNRGFRHTTRSLVVFLDADDLWEPTFLETLAGALETAPDAALAYCRSKTIDGDDVLTEALWEKEDFEGEVWLDLCRGNFVRSPGCVLFRRDVLERAGAWETDRRVRGNEDWELLLRVAEFGKFLRIEQPLFRYRVHGSNMSGDAVGMHYSAVWVLRKHLLRQPFHRQMWRWRWQIHYGFLRYTTVELLGPQVRDALAQRRFETARSLLWRACRMWPTTLLALGPRTGTSLRLRHLLTGRLEAALPDEQVRIPLLKRADTAARKESPRVSVVVTAYNHRDYILKALESVFAQTFTDYEVIVVNDGSPDDTLELLQPHADAGRIRLISQVNAGQAAARNRGIRASGGEFVALLDDDDLWVPDKLAWQVEAMDSHPEAAVVYGFPAPIDRHGEETEPRDWYGHLLPWPWDSPGGEVWQQMCDRSWLVSPGQALLRRSDLDGLGSDGPFDTSLPGTDDWDLWLKLAESATFHFEPRPALRYRFHGGNASGDTVKMRLACLKLYQRQLARHVADPERRKILRIRERAFRRSTPEYFLGQVYQDRLSGNLSMTLRKLHYVLRCRPLLLVRFGLLKFYFVTLWRANFGGAGLDRSWKENR